MIEPLPAADQIVDGCECARRRKLERGAQRVAYGKAEQATTITGELVHDIFKLAITLPRRSSSCATT